MAVLKEADAKYKEYLLVFKKRNLHLLNFNSKIGRSDILTSAAKYCICNGRQ